MVEGRDDWGISRQKGQGVPIQLIVYPGAYHAFDVPNFKTPDANCSGIISNSTRRQRISRSSRCANSSTQRSAERAGQVNIKAVVFDAYGTLYDVQSVAAITEEAFPGYGEIITQIWRIKQLEYTWLRSLMRRYRGFLRHHARSLAYTLRVPRAAT